MNQLNTFNLGQRQIHTAVLTDEGLNYFAARSNA